MILTKAERCSSMVHTMSIIDIAREKALEQGKGLNQEELLQVLQVPDSQLEEIADIAHQTRL